MEEKVQNFEAQITPPEQPTAVKNVVEIKEGTTQEEVTKTYQEIAIANAESILSETINGIKKRFDVLEFVDEQTYVYQIEKLKAELNKFHQKIQFAQYDLQYGLIDEESCVKAELAFNGQAFANLTELEGVAWILQNVETALQNSNRSMKDLQGVIDEAKSRLADLEQENNAGKEKAVYEKTILTRNAKLKPKKKKHDAFVREVNEFLATDPTNRDLLIQGAEKLLKFMSLNGWHNEEDEMAHVTNPQTVEIRKLIEKVVPAEIIEPQLSHASPKTSLFNRFAGSGIVTAAALVVLGIIGASRINTAFNPNDFIRKNWAHMMHETDHYTTDEYGNRVATYKTWCVSKSLGLSEKEYTLLRIENTRREIESALKLATPMDLQTMQKAAMAVAQKQIEFKTIDGKKAKKKIILNHFKQEILNREFLRDLPARDGKEPYNAYRFTVKRSINMAVIFEGGIEETYELPISTEATYFAKLKQSATKSKPSLDK